MSRAKSGAAFDVWRSSYTWLAHGLIRNLRSGRMQWSQEQIHEHGVEVLRDVERRATDALEELFMTSAPKKKDHVKPSFSVNWYDRDGDLVEEGIYLHFGVDGPTGEVRLWAAKDLEGFKKFMKSLNELAGEIEEYIKNEGQR